MAPQTNKPKPSPIVPAGAIVQTQGEVIDTRTGEIVTAGADMAQSDALDSIASRLLSQGDFAARLATAAKAKPEEFKALELDFWKPADRNQGEPCLAGHFLQGIFLGSAKMGRLQQHALAVEGTNNGGKPVIVRLNGTHALTNAFKQCEPKDMVRVEYMGESTSKGLVTGTGQTFKNWVVTKIRP